MDRTKPVLIVHPDMDYTCRVQEMLADMACRVENISDNSLPPSFRFADYRFCIIHDGVQLHDGRNIIAALSKHAASSPVVIISDDGDLRKAVSAIQNGAHDFFTKESDLASIRESLARAAKLTGKSQVNTTGSARDDHQRPIVTCSDNMRHMLQVARRVAPSRATVLINGESGTGKELLARFIHQHSDRQDKPFVAMNCAALPDNLAESELFGYEKGAFTGAVQKRKGKFEQAHGGTLLLDEISEMPLSLQVKLLRVLQEKEIDPIGGNRPVSIDVRVMATSNRDLAAMVKEGAFRQDLYYRLRVIPLTIPALRQRKADIELLVDFFVKKHAPSDLAAELVFSSGAMSQLANWTWPGNVRELENTVERAVLICDGSLVRPEHLLLDDEAAATNPENGMSLAGMTVKEMERKLIGQTLQQVNDNRTHAAKMLGISIRTLRNKLHEYQASDSFTIKTVSA